MFLQRHPLTTIGNTMSKKYGRVIDHNMIVSVLSTPLYAGLISWEGNIYEGKHEALVDADTYAKAQRLLADRRRIAESKPDPFKPKHLLAGLLVCGKCGVTYTTGHGDKKTYRSYYTCYSRAKTHHDRVVDISCRNPSYACKDLDAHIVSEVMELANDQTAFLRIVNAEKPRTIPEGKKTTLLRRIVELDAQMRRVMDLYQLGNISIQDIKERLAALEKEREALNVQLKEEAAEQSTLLHPSVAQSLLADFVRVSDSGDTTTLRIILRELVQRIIVLPEKGKLQIIWNF